MRTAVRMGVLGCADIARRRMLPAMAASADVDVVAVASRDIGKAERTARCYGCRAVEGYGPVLADDSVDAVYVPLPAALHADWVEAALRAGKHVLAEKPLTTDRRRTAELFGLAARAGRTLMENVMFVHHHQHDVVRRLVADGAIGTVRSFRAEFAVPRRAATDVRYRPELGGGALWDTGVYPVRAAIHLLGHEWTVVGASLSRRPDFPVDVAGAALLRNPDEITAHLDFGLDHGYRSAYAISGSMGRITVDRAFTPPADLRPSVHLERGRTVRDLTLAPADQVTAAITAFATAVRHGTCAGRAESLRQSELLDELAASCQSDRGTPTRAYRRDRPENGRRCR